LDPRYTRSQRYSGTTFVQARNDLYYSTQPAIVNAPLSGAANIHKSYVSLRQDIIWDGKRSTSKTSNTKWLVIRINSTTQ